MNKKSTQRKMTLFKLDSYRRHDGGLSPNEVNKDISLEHLDELKQGFCQTKVVVVPREVTQIENDTHQQAECPE